MVQCIPSQGHPTLHWLPQTLSHHRRRSPATQKALQFGAWFEQWWGSEPIPGWYNLIILHSEQVISGDCFEPKENRSPQKLQMVTAVVKEIIMLNDFLTHPLHFTSTLPPLPFRCDRPVLSFNLLNVPIVSSSVIPPHELMPFLSNTRACPLTRIRNTL